MLATVVVAVLVLLPDLLSHMLLAAAAVHVLPLVLLMSELVELVVAETELKEIFVIIVLALLSIYILMPGLELLIPAVGVVVLVILYPVTQELVVLV